MPDVVITSSASNSVILSDFSGALGAVDVGDITEIGVSRAGLRGVLTVYVFALVLQGVCRGIHNIIVVDKRIDIGFGTHCIAVFYIDSAPSGVSTLWFVAPQGPFTMRPCVQSVPVLLWSELWSRNKPYKYSKSTMIFFHRFISLFYAALCCLFSNWRDKIEERLDHTLVMDDKVDRREFVL